MARLLPVPPSPRGGLTTTFERREHVVLDLVLVAAVVVLFALVGAVAAGVERL